MIDWSIASAPEYCYQCITNCIILLSQITEGSIIRGTNGNHNLPPPFSTFWLTCNVKSVRNECAKNQHWVILKISSSLFSAFRNLKGKTVFSEFYRRESMCTRSYFWPFVQFSFRIVTQGILKIFYFPYIYILELLCCSWISYAEANHLQ